MESFEKEEDYENRNARVLNGGEGAGRLKPKPVIQTPLDVWSYSAQTKVGSAKSEETCSLRTTKVRRRSFGASVDKYESAMEKLDFLDEENKILRKQVSKLKLSLALTETEHIHKREPLSPLPGLEMEALDIDGLIDLDPENLDIPFLHDRSPSQPDFFESIYKSEKTSVYQIECCRKTLDEEPEELLSPTTPNCEEQEDAEEFHLCQYSEDTDWGSVYRQLVSSESFRDVGTGKSVLDRLSESSRKDVLLRYCDILQTIRNHELDEAA